MIAEHPGRNNAFTLLEVVVGMILVASLAVGSLTAMSRYQISLRQAERKNQALDAAERLIDFWIDRRQGLPGSDRGLLDSNGLVGEPAIAWQTRLIRQQILGGASVDVMRLDIIWIEGDRVQQAPTISIEFIRPSESIPARLGA